MAAVGVADAEFSADSYAGCTGHHRAHDAVVLEPVPWRHGMRVLDLGCGVGDLTGYVADLVGAGDGDGDGRVLGVDASASQVERARQLAARPGVDFDVVRAQDLAAAVPAGWADVVLTVATLHWVPGADQPGVLAGVREVLRPGGLLRVDMGGAGQIAAARAVVDEVAADHGLPAAPWFFPTSEEFTALLAGAGLEPREVRLLRQERDLPDRAALEGWLRSQVLPGYLRGVGAGSARAAGFAEDAVGRCVAALRRADGGYAQQYVRLHALAHRR